MREWDRISLTFLLLKIEKGFKRENVHNCKNEKKQNIQKTK